MADETRPCPQCGETIQTLAVLCRFCKSRFDAPAGGVAAPGRVQSAAPAGPAQKSSALPCLLIAIGVGVGGVVIIGILAALMIPAIVRATQAAKTTACANNLRQMWTLQTTYAVQFGGPKALMPTETGAAFWMKLSQTQPPLVDSAGMDVFQCPARENTEAPECHYRGPAVDVAELKTTDAVGSDEPGNHKKGGNVLKKDGSIQELQDPEFTAIIKTLKP